MFSTFGNSWKGTSTILTDSVCIWLVPGGRHLPECVVPTLKFVAKVLADFSPFWLGSFTPVRERFLMLWHTMTFCDILEGFQHCVNSLWGGAFFFFSAWLSPTQPDLAVALCLGDNPLSEMMDSKREYGHYVVLPRYHLPYFVCFSHSAVYGVTAHVLATRTRKSLQMNVVWVLRSLPVSTPHSCGVTQWLLTLIQYSCLFASDVRECFFYAGAYGCALWVTLVMAF